MEKEKIIYGVVFTRNGIVRKEQGQRPVYIEEFVKRMQPTNGVCLTRVRNDYIAYAMGIRNIYLIVYKEPELEQRVTDAILDAREKTEQTKEGRKVKGIFADDYKEENEINIYTNSNTNININTNSNSNTNTDKKEVEIESDSEDGTDTGWSYWKKRKSILSTFYGGEAVNEKKLQDHFISKNIPYSLSKEIAKEIYQIKKGDEGGAQEKEKIKSATKKVLGQIMPILMPEQIEKEIEMHKKQGKRPYVFCMVGVNGVGKSTTLSKLCLWLLKRKHRVCVAACDGFRSGAIEQLRKYVERYQHRGHAIHLFEKGYGKDESSIANQALKYAYEQRFDVVLIDTCGRMPGNNSSMLSLSKMIRVNKPEKIFYVGEALVGSDSIEQIRTFNRYIERANVEKSIDGIIVTKCDTVDDKIGTVVSLAHTVSKPVVFIGIGQKNSDLLPFDIDGICSALEI